MDGWWSEIGEPSLAVGVILGVVWGALSMMRRRRRFVVRGLRPTHQIPWFVCAALGMGGYATLLAVVTLLAMHDLLPQTGVYFVLGAVSLAYTAALLHGRFEEPALLREPVEAEDAADRPVPKRRASPSDGRPAAPAAAMIPAAAKAGVAARNGHDGEPASPAA